MPALNTDWWNYGGITRDVILLEVPGTFMQDYFLQPAKGSSKTISGRMKLNGKSPQQTVTVWTEEYQENLYAGIL